MSINANTLVSWLGGSLGLLDAPIFNALARHTHKSVTVLQQFISPSSLAELIRFTPVHARVATSVYTYLTSTVAGAGLWGA